MKGRKACGLCPRRSGTPQGYCDVCRRGFCGRHGGWDGQRWVCDHCAPVGVELIRVTAGG